LFCHRGHREHRDFFRNGFIRLRRTRDFRKKLFNHRLTLINADFRQARQTPKRSIKVLNYCIDKEEMKQENISQLRADCGQMFMERHMASDQSGKTSKIFYDLCYDQYKFEMTETNQIYQRVSFVLVLLSLLGSIIYKLGRIDIFALMFIRVDVFLYYLSILVAILLLAASVFYAILFALPRKSIYKNLASMDLWHKWRKNYEDYLNKKGDTEGDTVDDAMLRVITPKLAEAQANNAPINEKRRRYFHWCVLMGSLSIIPVSMQALFYLLLKLQGV
jgi:hypothetical protein